MRPGFVHPCFIRRSCQLLRLHIALVRDDMDYPWNDTDRETEVLAENMYHCDITNNNHAWTDLRSTMDLRDKRPTSSFVQTTRARTWARGRGSFVCRRAHESRYKPHEPRARVAPTVVGTSKSDSQACTGWRHVQVR